MYMFAGIILGVTVSVILIACCLSCVLFRRRCLKRAALRRARQAASGNFYPPDDIASMPRTSVHLRDRESCAAESHEMQHLVRKEITPTAMQVPSMNLDAKLVIY